MKKIIISILLISIIIVNYTSVVLAESAMDELFTSAGDFLSEGEKNQGDTINKGELENGISALYTMVVSIGAGIAVIVGVILGIKFMLPASAEEKAQYKKTLLIYLVGCIVIFGAMGIWKLVINIVNGVV